MTLPAQSVLVLDEDRPSSRAYAGGLVDIGLVVALCDTPARARRALRSAPPAVIVLRSDIFDAADLRAEFDPRPRRCW
ncbi:MAG: hypothetical protein IPJ19_13145 [Planctomycetes bacterium]|nr:hypothetical protein [Planctomycetota bacterium]